MNRRGLKGLLLVLCLALLAASFGAAQAGSPQPAQQEQEGLVRGAMLYDNWYAVLGQEAPAGNMPVWEQQTTNTRSGPETWRCVSCHGWDYQGRDGAYRYGSSFTGFPGVFQARESSPEEIVAALKGGNNPQHDFSQNLDDAALTDLATFINEGVIDDNEFIDPQTLAVNDGDTGHGEELYTASCASCHGEDGATLPFRFEGRDATLGTLAALDPWRFLHKTRFGTPGTDMPIGYELGWTPQDGCDVLAYARTLPTGLEPQNQPPSLGNEPGPSGPEPGGPASGLFTGILTALGAVATALGFAVMIGGVLVGIIFLLVWLVRGSKK